MKRGRGRPAKEKTPAQLAVATKKAVTAKEKAERFNNLCQTARLSTVTDSHSLLMNNTILDKTKSQYKSNLAPLRKWICTVKQIDFNSPIPTARLVSKDDFTIFLAAALKTETPLNEGIRSALLKEQNILGLENWAGHPECIELVSGFFYKSGNQTKKPIKGTITPEMFEDLLKLTISVAERYHDGQVVQYGGALRGCQLIDIQKGDYDVPSHTLTIRKDKRCKASNASTHKYGVHTKKILCVHAQKVLTHLQEKTVNVGDLLFPVKNWNYKNYSLHFKSCAKALGWNPLLKWDGSHILRHGGTHNIISLCNTTDINILKQACVMSAPTIKRYGEDMESRLNRAGATNKIPMKKAHIETQQNPMLEATATATEETDYAEDVSSDEESSSSSDGEDFLNYSPEDE